MCRKIQKWFFAIALSFLYLAANAQQTHEDFVNILSWWRYLDYPWINPYMDQKCNVRISADRYYSNDKFLNTFVGMTITFIRKTMALWGGGFTFLFDFIFK